MMFSYVIMIFWMNKKRILFLTGTRADFGKLKSLIQITNESEQFDVHIFVTGMHLQSKYGYTVEEIYKSGFPNIYRFINTNSEKSMDLTLAKTIEGLSNYVNEFPVDLIVVHGDRVEALAGAIVGSLNNIHTSHIEGGEVSGTIDELIRHSVSKMCHSHFVSNDLAKKRLLQMGELESSIKIIGSPDVDIMFSKSLPSITDVKSRYDIPFISYSVVMFHPVTTEYDDIEIQAENLVNALIDSKKNYVVIYPNNDMGSNQILKSYKRLENNSKFKVYPSIRFEYFLTLIKYSQSIIGNSSAGIREAPYYGIPTVNIGTRQENRSLTNGIINCSYNTIDIMNAILSSETLKVEKEIVFGEGNSCKLFYKALLTEMFWSTSKQKQFVDIINKNK